MSFLNKRLQFRNPLLADGERDHERVGAKVRIRKKNSEKAFPVFGEPKRFHNPIRIVRRSGLTDPD